MGQQATPRVCVDCEQKIDRKRLRADKNASRCLKCQDLYEQEYPNLFLLNTLPGIVPAPEMDTPEVESFTV